MSFSSQLSAAPRRTAPPDERFGDRLRRRRRELELSQRAVGEHVGANQSSVANWERGRSAPTVDKLPALADLLDVSIDWLLLGGER